VNPDILDSEVVRLSYLATLAATLTTTMAAAGASAGPATAIAFDHVVLTVADVEASVSWYADVLGMTPVTFGNGRRAVQLGTQKINLHAQADPAPAPVAAHRTPGAGDLCVVVPGPLEKVGRHLEGRGVPVEAGPVSRTGAQGPMTSLYVRDPDDNLVELGCYSP
jgi:catechol 2,3-dioxygenase-like lactoylglutathione lyase family enzyme